jgi:hypothetical protein
MSVISEVIDKVKRQDSEQKEFIQAVHEVLETLEPTVQKHPEFVKAKIYERIVEPDRVIMFRVPWVDDNGNVHVNRGFRVQFNNAIGPYKGGLRFHPSVNLVIIKFLGFEQHYLWVAGKVDLILTQKGNQIWMLCVFASPSCANYTDILVLILMSQRAILV